MRAVLRFRSLLIVMGACVITAQGAAAGDAAAPQKVPENTLLVKGAWPSASDSVTPLPEGGRFADGAYRNDYFGLTYAFSERWQSGFGGPPASDSGYYVLAQIVAADSVKSEKPGHMLVAAQDLFFTPTRAENALELVNFSRDHLDASVYKVERAPAEVKIANRAFVRFDYESPIAGMHWYVLATQIRCHVVEFVFTSRQPKVLSELVKAMNSTRLPPEAGVHAGAGGGDAPVCIKDYASPENIVEREDPILTEPRFNPIPVRIIIDRDGKVRHIHFLRAFPDQAKTITDAVMQWRFKPHLVHGQPVEVETGLMFGRRARQIVPKTTPAVRATTASMSPGVNSSSY
jgi:hypothetical protein